MFKYLFSYYNLRTSYILLSEPVEYDSHSASLVQTQKIFFSVPSNMMFQRFKCKLSPQKDL